jgi:hypothetical protein
LMIVILNGKVKINRLETMASHPGNLCLIAKCGVNYCEGHSRRV